MTGRVRRRAIVSGRVQGVGFRWSAREEAQRLGVAGSAVNREDGRVEIVAEGDRATVDALVAWLRHGPASARVDGLEVSEEAPVGESGFRAG